jgi:hypothetical protein
MEKILKIQSEIGVLSKTETNPFFKSKYMDINGLLAQLLPLLEKYHLTVIQPLGNIAGKPALVTSVFEEIKDEKTGETRDIEIVSSVMPLPDLQDPQKMGSAITYYRRYALQSLFLLQAQDDDGEGAKPTGEKKVGKAKQYTERINKLTDADDPLQDLEDDII